MGKLGQNPEIFREDMGTKPFNAWYGRPEL